MKIRKDKSRNPALYAVITGDIIKSSKISISQRSLLLQNLKESFEELAHRFSGKSIESPFEIYRGDSFQGVLKNPKDALKISIIIKAILRKSFEATLKESWDARIAVGIGEIDFISDKSAEGDGPAFRRSGPVMDEMKGESRFIIKTPWENANQELIVSCAFFDFLVSRWTSQQAEVVLEQLNGPTQQQIANKLKISQAAVNYRLKNAGWHAIEKFLARYEQLIGLMANEE